MESVPSPERAESITIAVQLQKTAGQLQNTAGQLQNTELINEDIPSPKRSKRQGHRNGTGFSCDQCEFSGTQTGLYWHKKSKHEEVRY